MLQPEDMVRVKRTLRWLAGGSVIAVVVVTGMVVAVGGSGEPQPANPKPPAAQEAFALPEDQGHSGEPSGAEAASTVEAEANTAVKSSGVWEEHYEQPLTGAVVDTKPVSYDQTEEGRLVMRFFGMLARAEKVGSEWIVPADEYREIVYVEREGLPVLANFAQFREAVMERGPWEAVGIPVPAMVNARFERAGLEVYGREVSVLVRSGPSDDTETYYQVFLDADFVRRPNGNLALMQTTTAISAIVELIPEVLPDYLAAYGVN